MNLLFDLDGTLTDPFEGITKCISYAMEKLDKKVPPRESLRWCIGPPLRDSFAKLLASDDAALIERAVTLYRERFSTVGLFENQVYDGIAEVLQALQKNSHTLYVATSKPTVFAKRIIEHFGLQNDFKNIYGCELNGKRGDKTSLISHVLQTEMLAPSAVAMIGDRRHDMIGAKENGISGFGVLWGYGTKEELKHTGARTLFKTPQELVTAFNQQPEPSPARP